MPHKQKIRVRIAPSPTGTLHLGTARMALFNYLFAKKNGGDFILRIEDTDLARSDRKYEKDILENLEWLGLKWDEEPCRQSERKEIYQKYIKKLFDSGQAFWCGCSKEELEEEKKGQMERKESPRHICEKKTKEGEGIIRFHCPDKKIFFDDMIKGRVEFDCGLLGDIGIARDEKTPLYNLAVVIDDIEMKISHVIRGEDHISNTPKQMLLLEAFGVVPPRYAHIPLTMGPDKAKLSKRHGATAIEDYKKMGYLPKALTNFMAFLGWHPGSEKEIFSLEELAREFSMEKMNKSNAIFDIEKLNWFNGQYIRQMDLDELTKKCLPYLKEAGLIRGLPPLRGQPPKSFKYLKKIVALERERLKKLSEIGELTEFFFLDKLDYAPELLIWKKLSLKEVKNNLEILEKVLSKTDKFDQKSLQDTVTPLTEKYGVGDLLWPLRVALTGRKASPGPYEVMEVLGKERVLERIKEAIEKIKEYV
ncbi:glutamate--tRNA ligase [Patescibacteria group bacterium]|nr:glutamate--tRNA ligase [Patescibacteria group bacterium]